MFQNWLGQNNVRDYGTPNTDYDYTGAFRQGMGRSPVNAHFGDMFKMPWHPSFSNESQYYQPGMSAGQWSGNNFSPMMQGSNRQNPLMALLSQLFGGG